MKFRLALASLVVLLVAALAGCSSSNGKTIDLNGNWMFTVSGESKPLPWLITQGGTQISIVSTIPGVTMVFIGTIDPSSGTFEAKFVSQNQTFAGQSTDGKLINGTFSGPSFGVMKTNTFVGVRTP